MPADVYGRGQIRFYLMVWLPAQHPLRIVVEAELSDSWQLACPIKEEYCGDEFEMIHDAAGKLSLRLISSNDVS